MTTEEVLKMYEHMKNIYGNLPNPDQEPIRFAYYVRLYKHFHMNGNKDDS